MMDENPWSSLSPSSIDARRVGSTGKHDFFWWISGKGDPGLMLVLPEDIEVIHPLPIIRSLDIRYQPSNAGSALVVILQDREQIDLFATFCRDVVQAGEAAKDDADALDRTIRRMLRWHHLLRGGGSSLLSKEEQRGLIGELHFLELLLDRFGARAAIEAWKGPEGSAKDFELHGLCVEVKARRGAARPWVPISSEYQLDDVEGADLVLRVSDVDSAVRPEGLTLTDIVRRVEARIAGSDMEAYVMWDRNITAVGYDDEHDYSGLRWSVGKTRHFNVAEGFPRIAAPVPEGVINVRYALSLHACTPFEIEEERFCGMLEKSGGTTDG